MTDINNIISTTAGNEELSILFIGIGIFSFILSIIMIISYIKIFKKANMSALNILWGLIPIVFLFVEIKAIRKLNKGVGYILGCIFLSIIFIPLLAFSDKDGVSKDNTNTMDNNALEQNNISSDSMNQNAEINNIGTNANSISMEQVQNNIVEPMSINPINIDTSTQNNVVEPMGINSINIDTSTQNNVVEPMEVNPINVDTSMQNNNIETIETTPINNSFNNENTFNAPLQDNNSTMEQTIPVQDISNAQQVNAFNTIPTQNTNIMSDSTINVSENESNQNMNKNGIFNEPESKNFAPDLSIQNDVTSSLNNNDTDISYTNQDLSHGTINENNFVQIEPIQDGNAIISENQDKGINNDIIQDNNEIDIPSLENNQENNEPPEVSSINSIEKPMLEETPTLIEPTTTEDSNNKICKNCGAKMPDIVTICPKCGTDNE